MPPGPLQVMVVNFEDTNFTGEIEAERNVVTEWVDEAQVTSPGVALGTRAWSAVRERECIIPYG